MSKINSFKFARFCALISSLFLLNACGGGGGGSDSPNTSTAPSSLAVSSQSSSLTTSSSSSSLAASSSSSNSSSSSSSSSTAITFNLEPTTNTTIGVGQIINVYSVLSTLPYPTYIDPSLITWTSSQPSFASINAQGEVTGLSEGTTTITAQYQTYSRQLTVLVSGQFITRSLLVTGQGIRQYSLYVPPFGADTSAHPLLFSLHGGGGSAMIQASTSTLNKLAQVQKFYVAYLNGTGVIPTYNAGNCCGTAKDQNVDDVAYVRKVMDDIQANYTVNAAKIYSTGFSNGSMMTHRLACAMADKFAAVAAVGGGSAEFDKTLTQYFVCAPSRPIPVLHIHNLNDRNFPFTGGFGSGLSDTNFYPIDSTIADWRTRNNVTTEVVVEQASSTATCYHYSKVADINKASAPVVLCKVNPVDVYDPVNEIVFGGGHAWPSGVRSPSSKSDIPGTDFNANNYIWNFLNP